MKPALATLSFLLFAFPLAFSQGLLQPVLDTYGNHVVTGSKYYLQQLTPDSPQPHGGGVVHGETGNSTCPVAVAYNTGLMFGNTVEFSIPGSSAGETIFADTLLEIEFADPLDCASSSKWMIFGDSIETQKAVLGIGGPLDHPGQTTLFGAFSILKSELGYKLVFCYLFEGSPLCSDIGTYLQAYPESLLVLTKNELTTPAPIFHFALEKADPNSGLRTLV